MYGTIQISNNFILKKDIKNNGVVKLKMAWYDLFILIIPQTLMYVLYGYSFSKRKVKAKPYIISVLIVSVVVFVAKLMPVETMGIPQIVSLLALVVILVTVCQINMVRAILAAITSMVVEIISEIVFFAVFVPVIFNLSAKEITNQKLEDVLLPRFTEHSFLGITITQNFQLHLLAMLTLPMFVAISLALYFILTRRKSKNASV